MRNNGRSTGRSSDDVGWVAVQSAQRPQSCGLWARHPVLHVHVQLRVCRAQLQDQWHQLQSSCVCVSPHRPLHRQSIWSLKCRCWPCAQYCLLCQVHYTDLWMVYSEQHFVARVCLNMGQHVHLTSTLSIEVVFAADGGGDALAIKPAGLFNPEFVSQHASTAHFD